MFLSKGTRSGQKTQRLFYCKHLQSICIMMCKFLFSFCGHLAEDTGNKTFVAACRNKIEVHTTKPYIFDTNINYKTFLRVCVLTSRAKHIPFRRVHRCYMHSHILWLVQFRNLCLSWVMSIIIPRNSRAPSEDSLRCPTDSYLEPW